MSDTTTIEVPSARRGRGAGYWLSIAIPALLTYVPLLLTQPGEVGADTKTYLYLNPTKVLSEAPYVWNSQIGMGTVTHQYIGYLWPMGPFYWLFQQIGVPDWFAQRIWLGTLMLAAGLGVRYLCRTLGWGEQDRPDAAAWGGILVASLAYMFSPYLLEYAARISVILLPWAALPWMIALTAKALRHGGWRYPALFALVVLTVGGINATALIMIGTGPLLYVVWAVFVDHEVTGREALAALWRLGLLTLVTSLWWIAGLWAEGRYGLPVIKYTETYKTVAEVSSAPEVLRGLGYWFFYGDDKLGPWTAPSATYTTNLAALSLSYLVPLLAIVAAALVRWRYRALFLAITVVGAFTAVASHPWSNPSLTGALFKAFTRTDAGLALRSTPRAVPLVILGLALFLGAGVTALGRLRPNFSIGLTGLASLVLFANLSTLWTGQMVAKNLERPENIPSYWTQAANYLQSQGSATRVLEVPGSDFASYRWGNTVDPITPGLMTRPYVAHELFQYGSAQSASLLDAFDTRFAEGDMDPRAIAPIARLMGAGDVVDRSDLQYERYRTARPVPVWDLLTNAPGLATPKGFGPSTPNVAGPTQPMVDEVALGTDPTLPNPPKVASFAVDQPANIVRTHPSSGSLLMAGDADGLVDAAPLGLLDGPQAAFFSASYATDPTGFAKIYDDNATLVVTDTNRKRAERWGTIREQTGYTEQADEVAPYDPTDQRLDVFPGETSADQTVTEQRGGATLTASDYGNPVTYTPDDRPANAMDGDPQSAWRVGALEDPTGAHLDIAIDHQVTTDHMQLLQPINLVRNRWLTRVSLRFDDRKPIVVDLDASSRTQPGQTVRFPTQTFHHLTITVVGTNIAKRPEYDGVSGVGFAEITIPGVNKVDEVVRPPTDLLSRAGASSIDHPLVELFTRLRSNPAEPVRLDEEVRMNRLIQLPTARSFSITGSAALSDYVPDATIDQLVGIPDASQGGITATSSGHLQGSMEMRASAALDGDPTTFWSGVFNQATGAWLDYAFPVPTTVSHLDLQLVADGRHSVPTQLTITPDGDASRAVVVDIPAVTDQAKANATVSVPVDLPHPVTGQSLRFTVTGARVVQEKDWYSNAKSQAPVAIAELGIPGQRMAPAPVRLRQRLPRRPDHRGRQAGGRPRHRNHRRRGGPQGAHRHRLRSDAHHAGQGRPHPAHGHRAPARDRHRPTGPDLGAGRRGPAPPHVDHGQGRGRAGPEGGDRPHRSGQLRPHRPQGHQGVLVGGGPVLERGMAGHGQRQEAAPAPGHRRLRQRVAHRSRRLRHRSAHHPRVLAAADHGVGGAGAQRPRRPGLVGAGGHREGSSPGAPGGAGRRLPVRTAAGPAVHRARRTDRRADQPGGHRRVRGLRGPEHALARLVGPGPGGHRGRHRVRHLPAPPRSGGGHADGGRLARPRRAVHLPGPATAPEPRRLPVGRAIRQGQRAGPAGAVPAAGRGRAGAGDPTSLSRLRADVGSACAATAPAWRRAGAGAPPVTAGWPAERGGRAGLRPEPPPGVAGPGPGCGPGSARRRPPPAPPDPPCPAGGPAGIRSATPTQLRRSAARPGCWPGWHAGPPVHRWARSARSARPARWRSPAPPAGRPPTTRGHGNDPALHGERRTGRAPRGASKVELQGSVDSSG